MEILILDNDRWVLTGLSRLLSAIENITIVTFFSAHEAMEYSVQNKPCLIIADIEMPEMNGLEFCRNIRLHYNPHIIIISGFDKFQYAREAIEIGVSNYVLKPINQQEFLNLVRQELLAVKQELDAEWQADQDMRIGFFTNIYVGNELAQSVKEFMERYREMMEQESYTFAFAKIEESSADENETYETSSQNCERYKAFLSCMYDRCTEHILCSEICHGRVAFCSIGSYDGFIMWLKSLLIISKHYLCEVTVGVSMQENCTSRIKKQFQQAVDALQEGMFQKQNAIYFYDVSLGRSVSSDSASKFFMVHDYSDRLVEALSVSFNMDDALPLIDEIITKLNGLSYSKRHILQFFEELLFLSTLNFLSVADTQILANNISFPDHIFASCETLKEMKEVVIDYLRCFCVSMQEKIIRKVDSIQYITDKMLNQDCSSVSLETVANELQIHRNYLSIMFKEKVGVNFKDYVLNFKMRRAKQLLMNQNMKMSRIAEELGYMDVKNFSRAFKSYTGQTPSDYRNSLGK